MELLQEVERTIRGERLFLEGDRIVAAVSGGPDSMALLHVLFVLSERIGFTLFAAHLNHGFRGAESEREAAVVAEFAGSLGVTCTLGHLDVPHYIEETRRNPQLAARELRYAFLAEAAAERRAGKLVTAHHADDQAETVLMRLLRGTGPGGLAGMSMRRPEKKLELIRPLLRIYKSELLRYCERYQVPYCTDSSNESRKYERNRLRLDIMPVLKQVNGQLPEALNRLAELARAEDEWMEAETRASYDRLVSLEETADGRVCRLNAKEFRALPIALQRRLIKLILNYVFLGDDRYDFPRVEAAREAITRLDEGSFKLDLHERIKLVREYELVRFVETLPMPESFSYRLEGPGRLCLPEARTDFECGIVSLKEYRVRLESYRTTTHDEVFFDADGIAFPLVLRSRLPGDRMEPFGLKGTKKVKDMFIDAKLPPAERDRTPIVLDGTERIVWIPGLRRAAIAPVSETTTRVLYMKVRLSDK